MQYRQINAEEFPPVEGESWWIVHPNRRGCEFRAPLEAVTVCLKDMDGFFKKNEIARIQEVDNSKGWISIRCSTGLVKMPFYLFARYFDAEAFVTGSATPEELESARPFDYRPTVPVKFKG